MAKKQPKRKNTRKFNGRSFELHSKHRKYTDANKAKKRLQKQGKSVRIVKGTKKDIKYEELNYRVFSR